MKRIYLLFFFLSSIIGANAQTLLSESFEGTFPPPSWTILKAGNGHDWTSNADPNLTNGPYPAYSDSGSMVYEYTSTSAANAWAITPALNLTGGTSYSISFFYRVGLADFPERLKVTVGNAATIAAQNTVIWNNNGTAQLTNTAWRMGLIKYTPAASGSFNFGFNCYSQADEFVLLVDDVTVEVTPEAPICTTIIEPQNLGTNVSTSPTFRWNSAAGATGYTFSLGTTDPPTPLGVATDTAVSLTLPLTPSTTYYWSVVPQNSGGTATGCDVYSFTTRAASNVPVNDNICDAITLALDGPADCQNTESATVEDSDTTLECSGANNTLWYKYTPTVSGSISIKMKRIPGAGLDLHGWVAFFTATGSCPSLSLTQAFDCGEADLITNDSVIIITQSLTANTLYYIMVDGFGGAIGEYCISLIPPPPLPSCAVIKAPANLATGVSVEPVFSWSAVPTATSYTFYLGTTTPPDTLGVTSDTAVTLTQTLAYNTTYYWSVVAESPVGSATDCDVYSFTTEAAPPAPSCTTLIGPADGATNVSAPATSFSWNSVSDATGYAFYIGTSSPPDSLGVTSDTSVVLEGQQFNTTYYWSVVPQNGGGSAVGCPVYSFTTIVAPPAPSNDECTGAVSIMAGAPVSGTTLSATESLPADSCSGGLGDANDDVWFKFTAVQSGTGTITVTPDLVFDAVVEAYSGDCASLVPISCADLSFGTETLTLSNLVAGNTYYLRVFGFGPQLTEGTFTITASGVALPVQLVNFKGVRIGSKNVLSWTTETEQGNKGFELQRSADGRNFGALVFVPSVAENGNSTSRLNYQFTDEKPFSGTAYYRLKQVNKDGGSTLSDVVIIKGLKNNNLVLSNVYPNPARTEINIVLGAPVNDKVSLVVTDIAGKIVMTKAMEVMAGDNNASLNVSRLPSGSYMIKAICANGCETAVSKFIKQ